MPFHVKPYTITQLAADFTSEGLPLLKLIESNVPEKEGTPYLFKAKLRKDDHSVRVHQVVYTDQPEQIEAELLNNWSVNGLCKIVPEKYKPLSHGEAALIEMANNLVYQ